MSNLIYVYGDATELEAALERLANAGLADKGRVIEGRRADASNGRDELRRERGLERDAESDPERPLDVVDDPLDRAGVVPPAAALGSHVPLGTTGGAVNPYAAAAVAGSADDYPDTHFRADLDDLVGADSDEAEHYADVLRGGGSLLVIEGGSDVLDRAESLLEAHQGQGFARH